MDRSYQQYQSQMQTAYPTSVNNAGYGQAAGVQSATGTYGATAGSQTATGTYGGGTANQAAAYGATSVNQTAAQYGTAAAMANQGNTTSAPATYSSGPQAAAAQSYGMGSYGTGTAAYQADYSSSYYGFQQTPFQNKEQTYNTGGFQSGGPKFPKRQFNRPKKPQGAGQPRPPQVKKIKEIKATEIKSFLYAWCGQRKMKPEYEFTQCGTQPNVNFKCTLVVKGIEHEAVCESSNKKDSQTKAAWAFADHLIKVGSVKESELPTRPAAPAVPEKSAESKPVKEVTETESEIYEHGGWTLKNARQRLNQFCQREHISPDFMHYTSGPEHSRTFICELTLQLVSIQKELSCYERGNNKKQATALCALSMVRKLFAEELIERQGEETKKLPHHKDEKKSPSKPKPKDGNTTQSLKRKAEPGSEESIDDNGNWTTENSRQRLHQFWKTNNMTCDYQYEEEGTGTLRQYTASVKFEVEGKEISASAEAPSKKGAAQKCAYVAVCQLFKLKLIDPYLHVPGRKSQRRSSNLLQHQAMTADESYLNKIQGYVHTSLPPVYGSLPSRHYKTDLLIAKKHKEIYPRDYELKSMHEAVRRIELALKETAEDLKEKLKSETPVLQGVVRVGNLAKGLVLQGGLNVDIVLVCCEVPTKALYNNISVILRKKLKDSKCALKKEMSKSTLVVRFNAEETPEASEAAKKEEEEKKAAEQKGDEQMETEDDKVKEEIRVKLNCEVIVNILLTSTTFRTLQEENKLPKDALDSAGCLRALAELRHTKWFQACASGIPNCVIVIRVLREMTQRLSEWRALDDWTLELLTARLFKSAITPLHSLTMAIQRVFECIGSGIFLKDGSGVADPCEKLPVDTSEHMTPQESEDLTAAAQQAQRLFSFRQAAKVLGLEEEVEMEQNE